ncbi:hypothetical protein [Bifidobacterium crudilactis]|uniref:hypothetical protein n=1 Tax=Bifidobacterium crudilactis TaxID=327277 RepID=UPI0012ECB7D0|nr:hypothetical protein [Bifidobacterium crudilactis]
MPSTWAAVSVLTPAMYAAFANDPDLPNSTLRALASLVIDRIGISPADIVLKYPSGPSSTSPPTARSVRTITNTPAKNMNATR